MPPKVRKLVSHVSSSEVTVAPEASADTLESEVWSGQYASSMKSQAKKVS